MTTATICMLAATPDADGFLPGAPAPHSPLVVTGHGLGEILWMLRSGNAPQVAAAADNWFFKSTPNCQAFLDAILAGADIPIEALLLVERTQRYERLFKVLESDPRWAVDVLPATLGWSETATIMWWAVYGYPENYDRVAQLADLPATPATDALLAQTKQTLLTGTADERAEALQLVGQMSLLRDKLVDQIWHGFELPILPLRDLTAVLGSYRIPASWWDLAVFEDDDNFTSTRFNIITLRLDRFDEDATVVHEHALAQLWRMLDAGRVDIAHVWHLRSVAFERTPGSPGAGDRLAPYANEMLQEEARTISDLRTKNAKVLAAYPEFHARVDAMQAKYDALIERREHLFRTAWLPAILGADEYARVQSLPMTLLRDLYVTQWEQGYEAYRTTMTGK